MKEKIEEIRNAAKNMVDEIVDLQELQELKVKLLGKKSELYLAKQLGDNEVVVDLTDYEASDTPVKVKFSYKKHIDTLDYKIDPSYVTVTIKKKVSDKKTVSYDLMNKDELDEKLSVKSVELSKTEVVVRGAEETLDKIASIKALIDLSDEAFTSAGTYDVDTVNTSLSTDLVQIITSAITIVGSFVMMIITSPLLVLIFAN